jgi:hypothetical protein
MAGRLCDFTTAALLSAPGESTPGYLLISKLNNGVYIYLAGRREETLVARRAIRNFEGATHDKEIIDDIDAWCRHGLGSGR